MKEKKNKEKNNKEVVTVFLVLLLVMVIIGVSYAAFTFSKAGTVENAITTGAVTMIYTEGDNQITINNAVPMTEDVGKTLSDENHLFDFTININIVGNTTISYEVTAEKDPSSTLANNEVRLYLQKSLDGTNYNEEVLDPSPYEPLDEDDEFGAKAGEMVLDVGSTNKTVMYYYRLRMWVDSSYELSEVAKTFTIRVNAYGKDGGYEPRSNRNIKGVYTYNQTIGSENYCVTGEEATCERTKCYQTKTEGSCPAGTIVNYKVSDTERVSFQVIEDHGDTMTMQSVKNLKAEEDYKVQWLSKEDFLEHGGVESKYGDQYNIDGGFKMGPLTALEALEEETANWKNVNDQTYTMGSTIFKDNAFTSCYHGWDGSLKCKSNLYKLSERTVKARMLTVQEVMATTNKKLNFLNISSAADSYWLMNIYYTTYMVDTSGKQHDNYFPACITTGGISSNMLNVTSGIRPVVVISK